MKRSFSWCLFAVAASVACQADFDPALLAKPAAGGAPNAAGSGGAMAAGATPAGAADAGGDAGRGGDASEGGDAGSDGTAPADQCPAGELCAGLACCATLPVSGGDFDRSYDASGSDEEPQSRERVTGFQAKGAAPARVSGFELDAFELTVGRFQRFVAAYDAWRAAGNPRAGAAAHPKIPGTGWQEAWADRLPVSASALEEELACGAEATYPGASASELSKPVNCLTWYVAMAYCAWEGKRLPTEAEWNYAAAGGSEQRAFPWSAPPESLTLSSEHAVYGDVAIRAVGSVADKDAGRFGHHDLAGNVREWTFDVSSNVASYAFADACDDCAALSGGTRRTRRGGDYAADGARARTAYRSDADPEVAQVYNGARCAR